MGNTITQSPSTTDVDNFRADEIRKEQQYQDANKPQHHNGHHHGHHHRATDDNSTTQYTTQPSNSEQAVADLSNLQSGTGKS